MRHGRSQWFATFGALAFLTAQPASGAPPRALLGEIEACVRTLDPGRDVGYQRVSARCPALTAALERSEYAPWLPRSWREPRNGLSAGGLRELARLLADEGARAVPAPRDTTAIATIVRDLGLADREPASLWARFRGWLELVLQQPRGAAPGEGVLERLVRALDPGEHAWQILSWTAVVLVMLLAGGIVANELRAAGWLRRAAALPGGSLGGTRGAGMSLHGLERARIVDRPALLLQLIADALIRRRQLRRAGGLTAREIVVAAKLADATQRENLAAVAAVAERVRFSSAGVATAEIERAVLAGRKLLEQMVRDAQQAPP